MFLYIVPENKSVNLPKSESRCCMLRFEDFEVYNDVCEVQFHSWHADSPSRENNRLETSSWAGAFAQENDIEQEVLI